VTVSQPTASFSLSVDGDSSAEVTSPTGQLVTVGTNNVAATVTPSGSDTHLTSAVIGTTGGVTVTPQPIRVQPDGGTASALRTGPAGVRVSGYAAGTAFAFTVGGLTIGSTYTVTRDGTALTQVTADGSGTLTFSDAPPTGNPTYYAVTG
jgi:hypothetical protein